MATVFDDLHCHAVYGSDVATLTARFSALRDAHPLEALDLECRFLRDTLAVIAGRGGPSARLADMALCITSGEQP